MTIQAGQVRGILDGVAAICMSIASLSFVWVVLTGRSDSSPQVPAGSVPDPSVGIESMEDKGLKLLVRRAGTARQAQAKVAVVEFSDFECPYCGMYARETFPRLRQDFVDPGKIEYVFMHFPLERIHPLAFQAAKAAACAEEQMKFWDMHDSLFADQKAFDLSSLTTRARELHLNKVKFDACLENIGVRIQADLAEGRRLGVTGTPAFFVGDLAEDGTVSIRQKISGARSYETFKTAIETILADRSVPGL